MKISYKTDYALKILLDLTQYGNEKRIKVEDIARRQDIPNKFLIQIVQILKRAGVISSKRGPEGGCFLSKKPEEITLAQIVRLFEGYLSPITCVSKSCYTYCNYEKTCPFREVWLEISEQIARKLENITIKDMYLKNQELKNKNLQYDFVI